MSSPTASNPSRALSVFVGTLAAFASFALIASVIQGISGGKPADPTSKDRIEKRTAAVAEQKALIEKYGLADHAEAVFEKAVAQIKTRKEGVTTIVVPGTPTALKQAAAAAPAPAPATPAPAGQPAPAPAGQPAPAPAPATNPK